MPFTTPKGYPFPTDDELPDVPRDVKLLAEAVNDADAATDIEIADIDQRLTTVEAQAVPGWTYIAHGLNAGNPFDIDVTGGGVFPAGTFGMIRLHARFDLDDDGTVRVRVNNQTGIHNTVMTSWANNDGLIAPTFSFNFVDVNEWIVAAGATASVNNFELTIYHTNEASSLPYRSNSVRYSATPTGALSSVGWGYINGTELLSVLNMRPFTDLSNAFAEIRWWLEGFRLP